MLALRNDTPFQPGIFVFPDAQGVDTLIVAVKATFEIHGGALRVAERQRPLALGDEAHGEPGRSSIRHAGEAHLPKPSTDVALVGDAWAPRGRPATSVDVLVRVGPVQKSLAVIGDRTWRAGVASPHMTSPEPFLQMPLTYERAYGGAHEPEGGPALFEERNPVGTGFRGKRADWEMEGMRAPNIEDPRWLIQGPDDRPPPAGVGFIAPSWEPRRSRAGTYDSAWLGERAPYLPDDFDPAFFNAAHPELVCPGYLTGGEPVEILNASPQELLRFQLPVCDLDVAVTIGGGVERPPMRLETVLLEPGELRLSLTLRGAVPVDKLALQIEQVRIGLARLAHGGRSMR
ncbi:MAG: DUF2169 domain-containing protein [Polyangiaceae bacterium]|nr:DUF2169 domain-containing protein [Polyangiaceae bacterium]